MEENYLSDEDLPNSSVNLLSQWIGPHVAKKVDVQSSPFLKVFYNNHPVKTTLDTSNMIKGTSVTALGIPLKNTGSNKLNRPMTKHP